MTDNAATCQGASRPWPAISCPFFFALQKDASIDQEGDYSDHWAGICRADCSEGNHRPWMVRVLCMPRS